MASTAERIIEFLSRVLFTVWQVFFFGWRLTCYRSAAIGHRLNEKACLSDRNRKEGAVSAIRSCLLRK